MFCSFLHIQDSNEAGKKFSHKRNPAAVWALTAVRNAAAK